MATISKLPRTLHLEPRINWTIVQEENLNRDYPFADLDNETPEQYVVRTYLQFLWLPEPIMPLDRLVSALQRVKFASNSTESKSTPHPLHALLEPIILTARTAAKKFQEELPKILVNEGGSEDLEEAMMWFALSYEKGSTQDNAIWQDQKWRTDWIRRMERREVQIQILLHFLILSLPGPRPLPQPDSPELSSVKRRKRPRKKPVHVPTPEERLEAYMDKLQMFQLMGDVEESNKRGNVAGKAIDQLSWTQLFCQNIVEPLFKSTVPVSCELLRSKVFPTTLFSDDEGETFDDLLPDAADRTSSPPTRHPSPALSTTSNSSRREPTRVSSRGSSFDSRQRAPRQRERSRSLSVSLAEEAEKKQKAQQAGLGPTRRRVLSREVSMTLKTRSRAPSTSNTSSSSFLSSNSQPEPIVKRERSLSRTGTILVEATPLKPGRIVESMSQSQRNASQSQTTLFTRMSSTQFSTVDEEEELWLPDSSPDHLLLTPGDESVQSGDEDVDISGEGGAVNTPTKARKRPRRT